MEDKYRLEYVDIFRGIPLLFMITIQIFDYLSVSDIYRTPPYYVSVINSVTWIPPSLLFTFVSGMSVFLLVSKRINVDNLTHWETFFEVFKRYGKYVLISLPFTVIMWNIFVYLSWDEAIQGIGLCAIFTALFLLLFFKYFKNISKVGYFILIFFMILFAYLQSILPRIISHSGNFGVVDILLNALFRGWFSIFNLFPIMLGGVLLISLIKKESKYTKLISISFIFLLISVLLHLFGYKINYYERSFTFTFFAIGQSALICSFVYIVYNKFKNKFVENILNFFKVFGVTAFFVYVTHYLLVLKVLEVTRLKDLLPDFYAWIITIPLVLLMYVLARIYIKLRFKLPSSIRL